MKDQEDVEAPIQTVVIDIMTDQHKNTALQVKPICINYIYGDYCNPCKFVGPKYDVLANKLVDDSCIFIKENIVLGMTKDIEAIPAFKVYYLGEFVKTIYGSVIDELEAIVVGMKAKNREYSESQF